MSKAARSLTIATNELPTVKAQPDFNSDSLSRMMLSLKVNIDPGKTPFKHGPRSGLDKVDFHCVYLYVRTCYSHLPVSPENLSMSLCMFEYFQALKFIDVEKTKDASVTEGRAVLPLIAVVIG